MRSTDSRILAVIPARGGSKRIPKKNIRTFAGLPLIAWTIKAAQECGDLLYEILVSTEDDEIAATAARFGAIVPFMRPRRLSTDKAKSLPVVQHATRFVEQRDGVKFDWILLLQPTSPLRTAADIRSAIKIALKGGCDSVISVAEAALHPIFAKKINRKGLIEPFVIEEPEGLRRQDVSPPAYMRNGAIYLSKRETVMVNNTIYGNRIKPYLMPTMRSIDIDTPEDWTLAEILMTREHEERSR